MAGFLIATTIAVLQPSPEPAQATNTDPAVVRRFMLAFLSNDQEELRKLGSAPGTIIDASILARGDLELGSLTLIAENQYTSGAVYSFAAELKTNDGSIGLVGFRVQASPQGLEILDPPPGIDTQGSS